MECEEPLRPIGSCFPVPPFEPRPIPDDLFSVYEGGPFRTCSVCSGAFVPGLLYEIQKVIRGRECVFEMAVCSDCGEGLAGEFSEESLEAMKGFLLCNFQPTLQPDRCHFCGFPRESFQNFTLIGACRESSLILPGIVMCEKCGEGLQQRLSRRTREIQGDFVQDHFPGIPADLDFSPTLGGPF